MYAKDNQSKSRSLFNIAKKAAISISIGAWVAVSKINHYAQAVFSKQGKFAELETRLSEKLKNTNASQIGQAFKESRSDVDIGWRHGGVFSELSLEYKEGVKTIFRDHGTANFVEKWRKVLTPEQKTKTLMFSVGAAAAIGAILLLHGRKSEQPTESITDDHSHTEGVVQKRVLEASIPGTERA